MKALILLAVFMIVGCLNQDGPTDADKADPSALEPAGLDPLAKQAAREEVEASSVHSKLLKCDEEHKAGDEVFHGEAIYSLGVINAKLKYFPAFRDSLNTGKIKTCEEARSFVKLYNDYYESVESYERLRQGGLGATIATETVTAKTGIYSGLGIINKKGVVRIGRPIPGGQSYCTGYMVSSREIITAAHCVMPLLSTGHTGTSSALFIDYWDPALPAGQLRALTGFENLTINAAPTFAGGLDVQSDIAVITRSVSWDNTTNADYLKMYTGTMSMARYNHVYGNGRNGAADPGPYPLRYERVYVDWYGEHYYIVLAEGHRLCDGDSGGPFIRDDATDDVVTGHLANVDKALTGTGRCSGQGEKERATRLNTKVGWIQGLHQATFGTGCSLGTTADNHGYMKCF